MQQLELSEIQGFLVRDYRDMPFSKYFLLQITNAAKAKEFIKKRSKKITTAVNNSEEIIFKYWLYKCRACCVRYASK